MPGIFARALHRTPPPRAGAPGENARLVATRPLAVFGAAVVLALTLVVWSPNVHAAPWSRPASVPTAATLTDTAPPVASPAPDAAATLDTRASASGAYGAAAVAPPEVGPPDAGADGLAASELETAAAPAPGDSPTADGAASAGATPAIAASQAAAADDAAGDETPALAATDPAAGATTGADSLGATGADATVAAAASAPAGATAAGGADTADGMAVSPPPSAVDPRPLVERVQTYVVGPGDSLTRIAQRFGIDVDTLRAANYLPDPDRLLVGQALTVLPVSGVLQTVAPGDTVAGLAQRYGVAAADIAAANGLGAGDALPSGQRVLIPGGRPLAIVPARGAAWPAPGTGQQQKAQFIAAAVVPAQASARQTGVPASVTIAQAILESDWGDSVLARAANNFFGIKSNGAVPGQSVYWMPAWEVVDDEDVESYEPFRAYASLEASFADHGWFFRQNSRYWPALYLAADPRAFAQAIADAGYATDPAYGAKLIRLMDQYNLYQYDVF